MTGDVRTVHVLVVEDGQEYTTNLARFLPTGFRFTRAGSGPEALGLLPGDFHVAFLDMKFDRTPGELLLGDLQEVSNRFNGDVQKARAFLETNQGTFVLAAVRQAGFLLPVLVSYDFANEPRRWANLVRMYGPLAWLPDNCGPEQVSAILRDLAGG